MSAPWYERYFTADYWAYADAEYTAQRTAAEVEYLAAVLDRYAPGPRVLDLGCGTGRHAVALARRGYQVTGLDVSALALARAGAAARAAGVPLTLARVDLLSPAPWPASAVDAAICVQAFGWGTDAEQVRLLRRVRAALRPGGVLLLDHSNLLAIARMYRSEDRAVIGGTSFHFVRRYDPVSGRSGGEVRVGRPDGSAAALPDDVRMYQPAEVRELLTRAGFEVSRVDADFTAGAPVGLDTRYVQFVAVPAAVPVSALDGHRGAVPPGALDHRWAPDEADLVAGALAAAWAGLAGGPPEPAGAPGTPGGPDLADRARRYDLADPYGGARLAPVLAAHLRWPGGAVPDPGRISAGAGVTGLLHALAGLAGDGTVLADPAGHPQLPQAAGAAGAVLRYAPLADPDAAAHAVRAHRPALVVLDRPGVLGPAWPYPDVAELAATVAAAGGVLVVDETCAAYLPPGDSCAPLTDAAPGVVVLRSMSKGFCCGGLRVGFAVASADVASRVRAVLPPLAAGALALDLAVRLLAQPDPLAPLRVRIAAARPWTAALLHGAGLVPLRTDGHVPWLVLPGDESTVDSLARWAVVGKALPVLGWDGPAPVRLSVPLSPARQRALAAAVTGAAVPG